MLTLHPTAAIEYWYFKVNAGSIALIVDWIARRIGGERPRDDSDRFDASAGERPAGYREADRARPRKAPGDGGRKFHQPRFPAQDGDGTGRPLQLQIVRCGIVLRFPATETGDRVQSSG